MANTSRQDLGQPQLGTSDPPAPPRGRRGAVQRIGDLADVARPRAYSAASSVVALAAGRGLAKDGKGSVCALGITLTL